LPYRLYLGSGHVRSGLGDSGLVWTPSLLTVCIDPRPPLLREQVLNFRRLLQVAACVNAVRQDPDGFACEYPCTYADWRDSVISPARGALVSSGTTGAEDLDA